MQACNGSGHLRRGGYNKKTTLNMQRIQGERRAGRGGSAYAVIVMRSAQGSPSSLDVRLCLAPPLPSTLPIAIIPLPPSLTRNMRTRYDMCAGSKWTAMQETLGWRHVRVTQQRKVPAFTSSGAAATSATSAGGSSRGGSSGSGATIFLLMTASCDETAKLWCAPSQSFGVYVPAL